MLAKLTLVAAAAVAVVLALVPAAPGVRHQQQLCFGAVPTITGSGELTGTPGDDVILGSEGADRINGFSGNDKICGGGGDDKIGGGPGNDEIDGGPGNDEIDGGPGTDTILGGDGDDKIQCGPDNDVVDGGPGVNTAESSGFEACETVTNASPPQVASAPTPHPLRASLTAKQPVPRPRAATRASGQFTATLTATGTGATLTWRLSVKSLTGPAKSAHVHQGEPGKTGPVLVRLCSPCTPTMSATTEVRGQPARAAILQGKAYVDVHTARNPGGEIRGQILKVGG